MEGLFLTPRPPDGASSDGKGHLPGRPGGGGLLGDPELVHLPGAEIRPHPDTARPKDHGTHRRAMTFSPEPVAVTFTKGLHPAAPAAQTPHPEISAGDQYRQIWARTPPRKRAAAVWWGDSPRHRGLPRTHPSSLCPLPPPPWALLFIKINRCGHPSLHCAVRPQERHLIQKVPGWVAPTMGIYL